MKQLANCVLYARWWSTRGRIIVCQDAQRAFYGGELIKMPATRGPVKHNNICSLRTEGNKLKLVARGRF